MLVEYLYLSDQAGVFPVKMGAGPTAQYLPWLSMIGPFKLSRSMRTDGGAMELQNVSGDTFTRDSENKLSGTEFEGALCVYRYYDDLSEAVRWEFHGYLTEPHGEETKVSAKINQFLDASVLDAPIDYYSEQCTLRYKGDRCGSASGLATCAKTLGDCSVRVALERYNGIPHSSHDTVQPAGDSGGFTRRHPAGWLYSGDGGRIPIWAD